MTRIPINDLERHTNSVGEEIRGAIDSVVAMGWFVLGPACAGFEEEFAAYCGTSFCVAVANGTDALEIGMRAVGIRPGQRVATVANAGFYATTAILQLGAEPVFIDVSPSTRLMDLQALERVLDSGVVDAVIITHLFGLMHDAEEARRLVDQAGIPMIEDCAQAHGAKRNGKRAGSVGHVGCFSFYPTKNLGALGDGGAIVTSDADWAGRASRLRQYGWEAKYSVQLRGGRNSRLDEIQAAVLRVKLRLLDDWNVRRRNIGYRYAAGIHHPAVSCPTPAGEADVMHLYVVETNDPVGLRAHLNKADISSDIHYPIPDYRQPAMVDYRNWPALPVTERLASRIVTLPCFPELTEDEINRIVVHINAW